MGGAPGKVLRRLIVVVGKVKACVEVVVKGRLLRLVGGVGRSGMLGDRIRGAAGEENAGRPRADISGGGGGSPRVADGPAGREGIGVLTWKLRWCVKYWYMGGAAQSASVLIDSLSK